MFFDVDCQPSSCAFASVPIAPHTQTAPHHRLTFISPLRLPSLSAAASLGALSGGRVGITHMAQLNMRKALTIALRYCAARRQFGDGEQETPVIEYPLLVGGGTARGGWGGAVEGGGVV